MRDPTAWSNCRLDADVAGGSYVGHLKPASRVTSDQPSIFSFLHALLYLGYVSGEPPAKCDGHTRVCIVYVEPSESVGEHPRQPTSVYERLRASYPRNATVKSASASTRARALSHSPFRPPVLSHYPSLSLYRAHDLSLSFTRSLARLTVLISPLCPFLVRSHSLDRFFSRHPAPPYLRLVTHTTR